MDPAVSRVAPGLRWAAVMRSITTVTLIALSCAAAVPGCAGATVAQRRQNASLAMATGAVLALAGLVVYATADDECKDVGGVCFELVDKRELQGGLLVVAGVAMTVTGAAGIPPKAPAPAAAPATGPVPSQSPLPGPTGPSDPNPQPQPPNPQLSWRPCSRTPARGACATPPPSDPRRTP
jgi:hypothetical protein